MNNWKQISPKVRASLLSDDEFYVLDYIKLDWLYSESSKNLLKTVFINDSKDEYTISFNNQIISIAQNANIIIGLICNENMHKATIEIQKPAKENEKFYLRMDKNFNVLDNSDIKLTMKKIEGIVLDFNVLIQKIKQETIMNNSPEKRIAGFGDKKTFMQWYMDQNKKCCYCGITEKQLELLGKKEQLKTKRITTRGYTLEVDRKLPNLEYSDKNCCMACYWCNNAKTDEFSPSEFKEIARGINKVWNERLKAIGEREIEFDEKSTIWQTDFNGIMK
ncbi:hypothetical protein [Campylobacter sp. RM16190]|uniref:hypothetical protein n=1 Tax=Campylobacter sp. RM16190 TaxID=1705727 RepID=UPI001472A43C|nr:hypothetical protein [Campylobacter sp. RM16190]